MAPEVSSGEPEGRREDERAHQRHKLEPRQDVEAPGCADLTFRNEPSGGGTFNTPIDLTEDESHDPSDTSRKHIHDGEYPPQPSTKRPKLSDECATIPETTRTTSFTSDTDTMSGDDVICSMVDLGRLMETSTKSKQENIASQNRELELERAAHSEMRAILQSHIDILCSLHCTAQKELKGDHQKELQKLLAQKDREVQSVLSDTETLKVQAEATRYEQERFALSQQEKLNTVCCELDATKKDLIARSTEVENATHNIKSVQEEHETAKDLYKAELTVNKTLERRNKLLEKRLARAKSDLKTSQTEHESKSTELITQIEELKAENEALQAALDSQTEQHNANTKDLLQQVRDSRGLSQRYNFRVSDEEILEEWGNLRHHLRQFVDKYTRPVRLPERQLHKNWMKLSSIISELAASPLLSAFAFEAYLWHWLRWTVFQPDSLVWAGSLGKSLTTLSSIAEGHIRGPNDELMAEYHAWRATSSNLLSRLSERSYTHELYHGQVQSLVEQLHELLGPKFIKNIAFQELADIVIHARDFEIVRRKLKSSVVIHYGMQDNTGSERTHDIRVVDEFMRMLGPKLPDSIAGPMAGQGPMVRLMVSPAIIRRGNSNGADYDRGKCLAKMDVLFSHSPDIVPELTAQRVPATGNEKVRQHSHVATEMPLLMESKRGEDIHSEPKPHPTPPGQVNQFIKAAEASMVPERPSRPPRAAKGSVRQKCAQALNDRPEEEEDELTGSPSEFGNTQ